MDCSSFHESRRAGTCSRRPAAGPACTLSRSHCAHTCKWALSVSSRHGQAGFVWRFNSTHPKVLTQTAALPGSKGSLSCGCSPRETQLFLTLPLVPTSVRVLASMSSMSAIVAVIAANYGCISQHCSPLPLGSKLLWECSMLLHHVACKCSLLITACP